MNTDPTHGLAQRAVRDLLTVAEQVASVDASFGGDTMRSEVALIVGETFDRVAWSGSRPDLAHFRTLDAIIEVDPSLGRLLSAAPHRPARSGEAFADVSLFEAVGQRRPTQGRTLIDAVSALANAIAGAEEHYDAQRADRAEELRTIVERRCEVAVRAA